MLGHNIRPLFTNSTRNRSIVVARLDQTAVTILALLVACAALENKAGAASTGQSIDHEAVRPLEDCAHFLPYSSDPHQIWNRLHRQLLERRDRNGSLWGCNDVDPLLWQNTSHLLHGSSYHKTISLLDEFSRTHAERLIPDPISRAIFQRDLWAVFDWLAGPLNGHQQQRAELQRRLAAIIKAVALNRDEIERLPDNLAGLRGSTTSDGFSFPDSAGGWMLIGRDDGTPIAPIHSFPFRRSLFLVYLKLPPEGLKAAAYLESMRTFSRQHSDTSCLPPVKHCDPPQFPAGTELVLVRRATLIDKGGHPVVSPVTETVQIRRYLEIPSRFTIDWDGRMQRAAEFQLTRGGLRQGEVPLRRVGQDEAQFQVFLTHGFDLEGPFSTLKRCHICHQGIGVISFTSYSRVQFADKDSFIMVRAGQEAEETAAAIKYLETQESWKQLQRMMP